MDWLLVATAVRLVTSVDAVDIQETKTFFYDCVFIVYSIKYV